MRSMEFSGRSVDEAIFIGLNEMGVTIDEVEIETIQDETRGLFGIGARQAVVRLTERENAVPMDMERIRNEKPEGQGKRRNERRDGGRRERNGRSQGQRDRRHRYSKSEDTTEYDRELAKSVPGIDFLKGLLEKMNIPAELSAAEIDGGYKVCIETDTDGLLIGKRGETLDALQYLTSLVANQGRDEYVRITLDTEGYRSRREETLKRLARREAERVLETGCPVVLEAMNPYERRILHCTIQTIDGVTTYSEGEELDRHVVIIPSDDEMAEE